MLPEEQNFPTFASGVLGGLYRAFLTDPDVFLLGVAADCLTHRRLRGLGASLLTYVTFRRLDRYVDVAVQLTRLHLAQKKEMQNSHVHGL